MGLSNFFFFVRKYPDSSVFIQPTGHGGGTTFQFKLFDRLSVKSETKLHTSIKQTTSRFVQEECTVLRIHFNHQTDQVILVSKRWDVTNSMGNNAS